MTNFVNPPPAHLLHPQKLTRYLLFKNNRICKCERLQDPPYALPCERHKYMMPKSKI